MRHASFQVAAHDDRGPPFDALVSVCTLLSSRSSALADAVGTVTGTADGATAYSGLNPANPHGQAMRISRRSPAAPQQLWLGVPQLRDRELLGLLRSKCAKALDTIQDVRKSNCLAWVEPKTVRLPCGDLCNHQQAREGTPPKM